MANAQIYQKTIISSVQDGVDKCLILDPNTYYQRPFSFGDNWNEIKIGIFLSYTFSVTNNNMGYQDAGFSGSIISGETTPDTYSWFGAITNPNKDALPAQNGSSFAGFRFNIINNLSIQTTSSNNRLGDNISPIAPFPRAVTTFNNQIIDNWGNYSGTSVERENRVIYIPYHNIHNTQNFCAYVGMSLKVKNKGQSNQIIEITLNRKSSTSNSALNAETDISLVNLLQLINGNDFNGNNATLKRDLQFNSGGESLPIPDSFFFYNAFLNVRPRFHAIAVKKID